MGVDFDKVLEGLGIKAESFDRVRLGRGVIGKLTSAFIAVCVPLAVVAYGLRGDATLLFSFGALLLICFMIMIFSCFRFASKNPSQALLEGAELITWKKMEMAAKDMPIVPSSTPISDPQHPLLLEAEDGP